MPTRIAPSILSADFGRLAEDIEMINQSQADWIHCDIMDGIFVPNLSFGLPIIRAVKKVARKPLDVHLMIQNPDNYIEAFRDAGADILSVHYEACPHLHRTLQKIKQCGMQPAVVLNPHTPVMVLEEILSDTYMVLLMSVNPGFGAQKFIPQTIEKVKKLRHMITQQGATTLIEIDGGITDANAASVTEAGVDILVVGNTVFTAADPAETIAKLKAGK